MIIRSYQPSDAAPTLALFRDTVQKINAKDYTADQIAVWAGHERSLAAWHASFMKHVALVALDEAETIIGFADMASDGYLDRLYVSAAHQREGVGKRLVRHLSNESCHRSIQLMFRSPLSRFLRRWATVRFENTAPSSVRHLFATA